MANVATFLTAEAAAEFAAVLTTKNIAFTVEELPHGKFIITITGY